MTSLILFHVQDPSAIPIGGALLSAKSPNGDWQGVTNLCGDFPANLTPGHYDITISASGFTMRLLPADLADCGIVTIGLERAISPRPPLPPMPPGSYDSTLPWVPPQTRDYLRGDAWGVTIPGLPFVPGGSSKHPERCLSWFFDRWAPPWQNTILDTHVADRYTHVIRSAPDSIQGNGLSLDAFVTSCLWNKDRLPYVTCFLGSKIYQPKDQTVAQWLAYLDPLLDALLGQNAVDEVVPGWEWNLWNVPGDTTIQVFKHVGQRAHAAGKSCWVHFSTEVTSWFKDGDPRGRYGFWDDLGGDVDGLLYQTAGTTWDVPMTQARIVDTLSQFGKQGNTHKFRFFEDCADQMFDGDTPTEDDANLRGYLACCTVDNVAHTDAKVWGFGNGARMPNGTPV